MSSVELAECSHQSLCRQIRFHQTLNTTQNMPTKRPLLGTMALIEARRSLTIVVTTAHAAVKSSMIRCNWIYLESVEGFLLRWQLLDPDANVTHEGTILKRRLEKWRTASGFVAKQVAAKIQTNLVIHWNVSLLIDGIYRRYMSEASASCTNTHKG